MKFGIDLPATYAEAVALDKKNGNNLWQKALAKEMLEVGVAFELMGEGQKAP